DVACLFQAEGGIRDGHVTGVQTCALPISGCVPQHSGERKKERREGGALLKWIIDECVHENGQQPKPPQRADGWTDEQPGHCEHHDKKREAAFGRPLCPIVMCLIDERSVVKPRVSGIGSGPCSKTETEQRAVPYHVDR